jgi:hypothetical protein
MALLDDGCCHAWWPSCSAWYASNAAGKSKALLAAAAHIVWASAPAILFFLLVCQPHAMNINLCPTYMVLGIRSSTVEWSLYPFHICFGVVLH